jgi:hypothetical protein
MNEEYGFIRETSGVNARGNRSATSRRLARAATKLFTSERESAPGGATPGALGGKG